MAILASLSACGGGGSSDGSSPPVFTSVSPPFVYVITAHDTVAGYTLSSATGSLNLLPGSPFAVPGGTFAGAVDRSHHVLYLSSTAGNTISAAPVNMMTGAVSFSASTFYATGGGPVAVAVDPHDKFVYTANQGSNDISAFIITTNGLTAVMGSPIPVGKTPYAVVTDPTGAYVYVANRDDSTVSAFSVNSVTGELTPIAGSPFPIASSDMLPVSLAMHPSGKFLYVGTQQDVTAYAIDSTGAITALPSSTSIGGNEGSIAIDPSGSYLYLAASSVVYGFSIDANTGYLQPLASGPFSNSATAIQLTIDPSGKFVLVTDNQQNTTASYLLQASDGSLTPATGSPFTLVPGATLGQGPTSVLVVD